MIILLQCTCPPTATCNEETGDCICAPNVTGEPGNECSRCEENTFGYDSITGCQECACQVEGTVGNANMSCSLETGQCYCKGSVRQSPLSSQFVFQSFSAAICRNC